jgi:hypothetical protein
MTRAEYTPLQDLKRGSGTTPFSFGADKKLGSSKEESGVRYAKNVG